GPQWCRPCERVVAATPSAASPRRLACSRPVREQGEPPRARERLTGGPVPTQGRALLLPPTPILPRPTRARAAAQPTRSQATVGTVPPPERAARTAGRLRPARSSSYHSATPPSQAVPGELASMIATSLPTWR